MNIQKIISSFFCFLVLGLQPAFAAIITASTTNISGNVWESNYTITNNSTSAIKWFTIYFSFDQYENFVYIPTPEIGAEWDMFTVEPFLNSDDGYIDAFSEGDGIAVGQSLSNFVVRYNFLGENLPIFQSFEVYDPDSLEPNPIDRGEVEVTVVPEPAILLLFGIGFITLVTTRKYSAALAKSWL
jgi:hypothetical protein